MSLRLRITILFTVILTVALAVFGNFMYDYLENSLIREIDKSLQDKAVEIFNSIKILDSYPIPLQKVILPDVNIFAATPDIYLEVIDTSGTPVASSDNLSKQSLPLFKDTIDLVAKEGQLFQTYNLEKASLRVYNVPLYLDARLVGVLRVGRFLNPTLQALQNLRVVLAFGIIGFILIALASGWLMTSSALSPIEKIIKTAKSIGDKQDFSQRIPYTGPNDEVGRLASTFNNMLERLENAYEQLEQAYIAQKRFVADASHELRTPLTTIRGNIELVQKMGEQEPEIRQEALQDIKSEAERMSRLVNDLLALARADTGQQPEKEPVLIETLLQEVIRQAKILAPNHQLEHDNPEKLKGIKLMANRDYLKQLLLILLDNAIKYTPEGGSIKIKFQRLANSITIQIEDTGIGIAEEDLPYVFDRFYQANKTRGSKGSGLGLAIAKWITEIHGGKISLESQINKGSVFNLEFFNLI